MMIASCSSCFLLLQAVILIAALIHCAASTLGSDDDELQTLHTELGSELINQTHRVFIERLAVIDQIESTIQSNNSEIKAILHQLRADLKLIGVETLGQVNVCFQRLYQLIFESTRSKRQSKRSATTTPQRNVSSMGLELTIETMRQSHLNYNTILRMAARLELRIAELLVHNDRGGGSALNESRLVVRTLVDTLAASENKALGLIHAAILDINHKLHTQHEEQTQRTKGDLSDDGQLMAILARLEDMVNKISAKSRIQELECRLEERDRECASLSAKVAQLTEQQLRPSSSPLEDTSVELRFGEMLASAAGDNTIRLWDVASGECVRTIDVRTFGDVWADPIVLEFVDTVRVASGSKDNAVKVWHTGTGQLLQTLRGHSETVNTLKRIDADRIASGSHDKTIRIWALSSGKCLTRIVVCSF